MTSQAPWWDIRFRIDKHNHLMKQNENALCKTTGWPLVTTLDMTLHKLCCLRDDHWVLAVIELDGFPDMEALVVALTSKETIQKYSKTNTIMPFLLLIDGRRSFKFALLINSYLNLNPSKSLMNDVGEKILEGIIEMYNWRRRDVVSKSTKCKIGIGKMNLDAQHCDWDEWKQRVFGYVDKFNSCDNEEKSLHLYCDIDHELVSPDDNNKDVNIGADDEKDSGKTKGHANISIHTTANPKTNTSNSTGHVTATVKSEPTNHIHLDAKNVSNMNNLVNQTLVNGNIIDMASAQQLYPSWNQRRDIATQMIEIAKRRDCETRHVKESRRETLKTTDKLYKTSQQYIAVQNWFVKTYSYLSLLKQKIDDLLSDLVAYFEQYYQCNKIQIYQFDILFWIDQYLDNVCDLLILFYTCYNWDFISIFYPFIKQAIGEKQCELLFCNHKYTRSNSGTSLNASNNYNCNSTMPTILLQATKLGGNEILTTVQYQRLMKVNGSVYFVKELFYDVNGMATIKPAWLSPDIDNSKHELTLCDLYNYTCSKLREAVDGLILSQRKLFYFDDQMNIQPLHLDRKSMVPNFIRLFVLNRILLFQANIYQIMLTQVNKKFNNKEHQMLASSMIKFLYENGIKSFMDEYYNELKQSWTIDLIFDKIIYRLFDIEYQKVTTYRPNKHKNNRQYISNVFNTTDLMCLIFQFVYHTFDDCQNTSLVCSYWMYYSFDTKSHVLQYSSNNVQYNGDSKLPTIEMQIKQFYQYNTKSLEIDLKYYTLLNQNILCQVSTFKNIEIIDIKCMGHHVKVTQLIVDNCGNNIKSFKSEIYDVPIKLPLLKLPHVKSIEMNNLCFPIIFSKKCQILTIKNTTNLSHQWFKFLFDNCDCTNLKQIKFEQVTFKPDSKNNNMDIIDAVSNVATKLVSLQSLEISLKPLKIDCYLHTRIDDEKIKKHHLDRIEQLTKSEHLWDVFVERLIDQNGQQLGKNKVSLSLNYHNYTTLETDEIKDATIILHRKWYRDREQILKDLMESSLPHYKVYPNSNSNANSNSNKIQSKNCLIVDMYGPNSSPYRGSVLKMEVFMRTYPYRGPHFRFKTKINHVNIDFQGRIHMEMNNWNYDQRGSVNKCLDQVFELLTNIKEDELLTYMSNGIDKLYVLNRKKYFKWARR